MTPARAHQIREARQHYLALPPEKQSAFLQQLRTTQPDLAAALEADLAQQPHPDTVDYLSQAESANAQRTTDYFPTRQDSDIPTQIGRYHIDGTLGEGGMGIVYRGRDPDLKRFLAVKVIKQGRQNDADLCRRFLEEAQVMGQLQHPGIAPIHEIGTLDDGRPFFSMKQVEGHTLAELLKTRRETTHDLPRFRGIFEQICQTLAYAHSQGIIHRDLKPANVMVGAFGEVQVMDWGLAKHTDHHIRETSIQQSKPEAPAKDQSLEGTQTGMAMGTPAYMAPEQARGDIAELDQRADVFGLGAILCQILTGKPAYTGNTSAEIMVKASRGDLDDAFARLDQSGADDELITLCKRCLAAEKEHRPRDAAVVAEAVAAYQEAVQEKLRQVELKQAAAAAKAAEERRRRRIQAALAVVVLLLAVVGIGTAGVVWQWQRAESSNILLTKAQKAEQLLRKKEERARKNAERLQGEAVVLADREKKQRKNAEIAQGQAEQERDKVKRLQARIDTILYRHQLELARREWEAGRKSRAREILEGTRWDLRGWEYDYLYSFFEARTHTQIAYHRDRMNCVRFSPNGEFFAGVSSDSVFLRDAKNYKLIGVLGDHKNPEVVGTGAVCFSPDGSSLVTGSKHKTIRLWNTSTWKAIRTIAVDHIVTCIAFSPNGKTIAASTVKPPTAMSMARARADLLSQSLGAQALTPAGGPLAATTQIIVASHVVELDAFALGGFVKLWDAETGNEKLTLKGHRFGVSCVSFSPDGKWIASGGTGFPGKLPGTVRLWNVETLKEIRTFGGHGGSVGSVCFSPDGKQLVSADYDARKPVGAVHIWDIESGKKIRAIKEPAKGFRCVSFSPDGTVLAGGCFHMTNPCDVVLWDPKTGKELHRFQGHKKGVSNMHFSPDGRRLLTTSMDNSLRLWDMSKIETVVMAKGANKGVSDSDDGYFAGHTGLINHVAFSRDGKHIVSSSHDKTVRVWNITTGEEILTLKHPNIVSSFALSPDGRRIISGSRGFNLKTKKSWGEIRNWDTSTGKELLLIKGPKLPVTDLAISSDGKFVVGCDLVGTARGAEGVVKSWSAETGEEIRTFGDPAIMATAVALSPDDKLLITNDQGGPTVWNVRTGQKIGVLKGHSKGAGHFAFNHDGTKIATSGGDTTVRVWDTQTLRELLVLRHDDPMVKRVAFGPDGKRIFSLVRHRSLNSRVVVWDVATREKLFMIGDLGLVFDFAISSDGKRIMCCGSGRKRKKIILWDATRALRVNPLKGHSAPVFSTCFSPDGTRLASGGFRFGGPGELRIWNTITGRLSRIVEKNLAPVNGLDFSPDGKTIATACQDKTVKVWHAATGEKLLTLKGHTGSVNYVCFSPDAKHLATASSDKTIRLWDANAAREIHTFPPQLSSVRTICFSPDGHYLASGGLDGTIKIWDVRTRKAIRTFHNNASVVSLCFSPNGKHIASNADKTIKVWNMTTGQVVRTLTGHADRVRCVRFSPVGRHIASADGNYVKNTRTNKPYIQWTWGEVKLWNVQTGKEVGKLRRMGMVLNVSFSPDGKRLAVAGSAQDWNDPGELLVWDLSGTLHSHKE